MQKFTILLMLVLSVFAVGLVSAQENAAITITSPAPGAVLENPNVINVTGTGTALFENSLTVQARDANGQILTQQPVITDAPEVGGTGNWQTTLAVNVPPGTAGDIRAFAVSANDGSVVAEAIINVTFGSATPPPSSITISTPASGELLPNEGSFVVRGQATNILGGSVIVQARDEGGNVIAEQSTVVDEAIDGTGQWEVTLAVVVPAGTNGSIRAAARLPDDSDSIEAVVNIVYGAIPPDVGVAITFPANGAVVNTAGGVAVTGTTRNIFDGRVVVQLRDGNNNILAERSVTSSATEGEGQWETRLDAYFVTNVSGSIVAYTPNVGDGGQFLTHIVFVTFQPNCAVRTDWPVYVVQRGDTLNQIARRVGSTVAELAQGNCMNNINIIEVGRQLRVPRLPATPLPEPEEQALTITTPQPGATLDISAPVIVSGTAVDLTSLVVQALDANNNVLAAQTVAVRRGQWEAALSVGATPGTSGRITAFATSPDGRVVASGSVRVNYGQQPPEDSALEITSPQTEDALNTAAPVIISGTGAGLVDNLLRVRVLDNEGGVLADQPVIVGADGTWTAEIAEGLPASGRGIVLAYALSATDDAPLMLADSVNVIFGTAQPGAFVTISDPMPYALIEELSFKVGGRGGGLFEGNVVVRVLDRAGNVILEEPTILNAQEVGGEGEWELDLTLDVAPGTRGVIEAYSPSPQDGSLMALARVPVIFGQPDLSVEVIHIVSPLPDVPLTAESDVLVQGYAGQPIETVTVQIIDDEGNILASQPAQVNADDRSWQAPLTLVSVEPGTVGRLVAFAIGEGGTVVAADSFEVSFAEESAFVPVG